MNRALLQRIALALSGIALAACPEAIAQPDARYLPPGGGWRLGVRVQNFDTGVLLTQVLPGSAAARAGLERNDIVITVGGRQVGYVDGRLVDVAEACARRADSFGRARLLIRNGRNGQLTNIPVQLDQGGVVPPVPPVPPPNAVAQITAWYRTYLGRNPDPQGLQAWLDTLNQGTPPTEVECLMLSSTECFERFNRDYRTWITGLYQMVLSRTPNAQEVQNWLNRIRELRGNRLAMTREFVTIGRQQG